MKGFRNIKNNNVAVNKIKSVNYQVVQFSEGILDKYDDILTIEEKDSFRNLMKHMINLNESLSKL